MDRTRRDARDICIDHTMVSGWCVGAKGHIFEHAHVDRPCSHTYAHARTLTISAPRSRPAHDPHHTTCFNSFPSLRRVKRIANQGSAASRARSQRIYRTNLASNSSTMMAVRGETTTPFAVPRSVSCSICAGATTSHAGPLPLLSSSYAAFPCHGAELTGCRQSWCCGNKG